MSTIESRLQRAEKVAAEIVSVEQTLELSPATQAYIQSLVALLGVMDAAQARMVYDEIRDNNSCHLPAPLTLNVIRRALRHSRGDARPLVLPAEVAAVYLEPRGDAICAFTRECLSCGFDVPDRLPDVRFPVCPLCGGEYEPIQPGQGVRFSRNYHGWSKANPDKSVSMYVLPNGSFH